LLGVTLQYGKFTTQVWHEGRSHFLGRYSTRAEAGRVVDAALTCLVSMQVTNNQRLIAHCTALSSFGGSVGKGMCHKIIY